MISLPVTSLPDFSDAAGLRLLLDPVFKSLLLIILAALGSFFLRHKAASLRSTWLTVLLAGLVLVPGTGLFSPWFSAPVVTLAETSAQLAEQTLPAGSIAASQLNVENDPTTPLTGTTAPSGEMKISWRVGILFLWCGLVIFFLLRMVARLLWIRQLSASARPLTAGPIRAAATGICRDGGCDDIEVALSEDTGTPFVFGWPQTRLILPAAAQDWPANKLTAILHHELAHIRRHDFLRLLVGELACALNWYNPLVWRLAQATALSHEMACDEHAIIKGGDRRFYARTLLNMAAGLSAENKVPVPGLARPSGVELRLLHMMQSDRGQSRPWTAVVLSCLALLFLLPVLTGSSVRTVELAPVSPPEVQASEMDEPAMELPKVAEGVETDGKSIHGLVREGAIQPLLQLLQDKPGYLEYRDEKGMTPLAVAAWNGNISVLDALLALGADPDARNNNGLVPVFSALDRGKHQVAARLADAGADLKVTGYRKWTLLHAAARTNDEAFVQRLLDAGVDPDALSTEGRTALHWAQRFGYGQVMVLLRQAGARDLPNPKSWPEKPTDLKSYR